MTPRETGAFFLSGSRGLCHHAAARIWRVKGWGVKRVRSRSGVPVLLAGLAAVLAFSLPAEAMSYRLLEANLPNCKGACPKVIVASGTIQADEHHLFADFVETAARTEKLSSMMVVDSPGGFFGGAAILGAMIRKLKMTVIIGRPLGEMVTRETGLTSATCASACVLVLAGGVSRYYVTGSRIGVHRSHTGPEVRDPTTRAIVNGKVLHDEVKDDYIRFFRQMGIDPRLTDLIDKTPSEQVYWLSPQEMAKFRLARDSATAR